MNGGERFAVNVLQAKLLYDTAFCGNMSSLQCVLRKLWIQWKRRKPERCWLQDNAPWNIHWNSKVTKGPLTCADGRRPHQIFLVWLLWLRIFCGHSNRTEAPTLNPKLLPRFVIVLGRVSYPNVQESRLIAETWGRRGFGWWRETFLSQKFWMKAN